jgi:hypothetical protein
MIASVAISGLTWRASRYGENYLATEIDRLEALLLQCEGAPTEMVEECLDMAHRQGARLFELRSATALARVMAEHNKHKAVDILSPIYNCFTEGLRKPRKRPPILVSLLFLQCLQRHSYP